jgi:PAS domain S-box-containing protein
VHANPHFARLIGMNMRDARTENPSLHDILHPEDAALLAETIKCFASANDTRMIEREQRIKNSDGEWCWLHARESVYTTDESGVANHVLVTAHDITKHRHAVEALERVTVELRTQLLEQEALLQALQQQVNGDERIPERSL